MYHELLIALSGIPGSIFKHDKLGSLHVTRNLPFLHPSEIELLDKLCKLGSYYGKFQHFIELYSVDLSAVHSIIGNEKEEEEEEVNQALHGQYLHAFCAGLSSVMQPYQDSLVNIEQKVMSDPHLPLSYIHQGLEDYFFIFPTLASVIKSIETKKIHGCQLLELLQQTANCGIPSVKETIEKILHTCHSVLYKQMSAWMLHGILLDHYKEFFITDCNVSNVKESRIKSDDADELDGAVLSSNTILRGVTGKELLEELQLEDDAISISSDLNRISIVHSMLPFYIPDRVAEKVLFIGKSVQMLKDTENIKSHQYTHHNNDLLNGRETEFLQTLHKLQRLPHLSIPALENEIDKIKACVAEQLWKLVVEDADLIKHLKLLKEMYLLGRGELYLTFIDHASTLMRGLPTKNMSYDINAAFVQSLAKILTYSEEYERLFSVSLNVTDDDVGLKTMWDHLKIIYHPPWPLHLLFTKSVMEKYNSLFAFLLKVRRTQIELQNVWASQMSTKRSCRKAEKPSLSTTWGLRRRMAFFVDNLQYYLQVDVLESQFTLLLDKIKKTHDFESIQDSIEFFLVAIQAQTFITTKSVYSIIQKILFICMSFCELISISASQWDEQEVNKTAELAKDFDRQTSLLFTIVSNVRSHHASPHLPQLLLRIDFNKYFTKTSANTSLTNR